MSENVYFFNDNQKLIKILGEDDLISDIQEKEITPTKSDLINDKLSLTTSYDEEIKDAVYMAVRESESSFSMYKILSTLDADDCLLFSGVNFGPDELDGFIVKDIRPSGEAMHSVAQRVIDFTEGEWRIEFIAPSLPIVSTNFYFISVREALKQLQEIGCEILFYCNLTGEGVTDKWIEIYKQVGEYSNERFEYGDQVLSIQKEVNRSNVYTSLIGRGRGEEVGDGYGRRIEFDQVEWKKSNGDPLDKPKGQIFLEFPEMTKKYGLPSKNGSRIKREKVEIFENCEDPNELLRLTYDALVMYARPLVQFKTTILSGDTLGNIVTIHRADRNYHYETRIFSVKKDRLKDTVETGLGDNLNTSSTRQASNTQNALSTLSSEKMSFFDSTEISKWQSDIIRGAKGGSVILMSPSDFPEGSSQHGTSRQPFQQVWMNGDSIATSNNFLVANSQGIGFIEGDFNMANFKTAWDIEGNFNANFITVGKIIAEVFETSFNALGDVLQLVSGALQIYNNKKKIMELTKKGMQFWSVNGEIGTIGTTDSAGNPFPDASTPTPIEGNALVIRANGDGKYILISPVKDKGLVMLGNGKGIYFGDLDVQGKLTINAREVFPGQGGGSSGSEGGQGNNWNGQYPPGVTTSAEQFAWQAWVTLLSLGYSKAAAAGILGNINGEAGPSMNPDIDQIGGPAYGAIQFDGSAYPIAGVPATSNGRDYVQSLMRVAGITDDYRQMVPQMKLVNWANSNGQWIGAVSPTTVAGFKAMSDPAQAAYVFEKNFERPANSHPEREGFAVTWYNKFKDLKIPQANSDIVSIGKSLLGYFTYELIHGEAYIGSVANPDRNGRTDCSGFVWLVLAKAGYRVPGNMQWYTGSMTSDARGSHNWFQEINENDTRAGDVVIYNVGGGAGANGHTAILLEKYRGNDTQIIQMGGDSRYSGVNTSTIGYSFGSLLGGDRCLARAVK
ncbi:phage tail spike protein [Enterococcus devriesei]|uniref:phage tail spike protein n=1 Tax=Enterococcus devriesei TaxID=319970 RepID=UPI0028E6FBB0|nr:phage tail spike protein [Enterococcus devriesei]